MLSNFTKLVIFANIVVVFHAHFANAQSQAGGATTTFHTRPRTIDDDRTAFRGEQLSFGGNNRRRQKASSSDKQQMHAHSAQTTTTPPERRRGFSRKKAENSDNRPFTPFESPTKNVADERQRQAHDEKSREKMVKQASPKNHRRSPKDEQSRLNVLSAAAKPIAFELQPKPSTKFYPMTNRQQKLTPFENDESADEEDDDDDLFSSRSRTRKQPKRRKSRAKHAQAGALFPTPIGYVLQPIYGAEGGGHAPPGLVLNPAQHPNAAAALQLQLQMQQQQQQLLALQMLQQGQQQQQPLNPNIAAGTGVPLQQQTTSGPPSPPAPPISQTIQKSVGTLAGHGIRMVPGVGTGVAVAGTALNVLGMGDHIEKLPGGTLVNSILGVQSSGGGVKNTNSNNNNAQQPPSMPNTFAASAIGSVANNVHPALGTALQSGIGQQFLNAALNGGAEGAGGHQQAAASMIGNAASNMNPMFGAALQSEHGQRLLNSGISAGVNAITGKVG